jgi:hypothetical protein
MANDFESHKAELRELYLIRDRTLKEIVSQMRSRGFDKRYLNFEMIRVH